jgi:hypothetical protein
MRNETTGPSREGYGAAYHRLPYKALPRTLIRYLVTMQASQLNLFPAKGGILPYYSPRTILGLPVLDYEKHCAVPFGAYIQANHETNQTNSNAARTIDAIFLCPAINMQGGHELYDLNSRKKKNQNTTERPLYPNKRRNCKEANLEDLQERADQCQDSSLT